MKFWQLVSMFRDDLPSLENVLREPVWATYLEWLGQFNELVRTQNRKILDDIIPQDLLAIALQVSKLEFCIQNGLLKLNSNGIATNCPLSALDVYTKYGSDIIEDILEHGAWRASS